MTSANLTTRSYTAQTCKLTVSTKAPSGSPLNRLNLPNPGNFTLQIDASGEGLPQRDPNPIVLNGQLDQLDKIQHSVSQYVAQLVAEFPLATDDRPDEPIPEAKVVNRLYPSLGINKNLPGLRHQSPQLAAVETIPAEESFAFSALTVSKLLNRSNPDSSSLAPDSTVTSKSEPNPISDRNTTLPRLTVGDRPLEHHLYVSDNNLSERLLILTQSQLFDLGTTLDEYAAAKRSVSSPPQSFKAPPEIKSPQIKALKIETPQSEDPEIETPETEPDGKFTSIATPSGLSQLPNLPNIPAKSSSRTYDYGDENRPAFLSALPWVATAALAIGVPFLLFDLNPNLLKESMAKVKMPSDPRELLNSKNGAKSGKTQQPTTNPSGDDVANAATTGLKPWDPKSVQPPGVTTTAASPGTLIPQPAGANQIGIAPLPPSIVNATEGQASLSPNPAAGGVAMTPGAATNVPSQTPKISPTAANPLSSSGLPAGIDLGQPQQSIIATKPSTQLKPNPVVAVGTKSKTTKSAIKPKNTRPYTTLPISISSADPALKPNKSKVAARNTGNVSSYQAPPFPSDFGRMGNEPPLTQPAFPDAKVDNPTPLKSVKQQKKVVKSKLKPVVVAKKASSPTPLKNSQPKKAVPLVPVQTPEPTTVPPELVNPPGMPENNLPQTPPIITQPQLQSKNNANSNPFDNPLITETKRYFKDKWRADSSQTSPLQYVVQVNAKSGVVQNVSPQGEAASTYLKKSGVIKAGQKLGSPTGGEGDIKIRVLFQPDGTVDAFDEP